MLTVQNYYLQKRLSLKILFTVTELILFILTQQPRVGQGLLIHEVSRSHTTTHYRR